MDLLRTEDVASVILFDLRLSEGEIQTFATALAYLLETLDDEQLHAVFNEGEEGLETPSETRQFLEMTLEELVTLLQAHCHAEYLPPRFRAQRIAAAGAAHKS